MDPEPRVIWHLATRHLEQAASALARFESGLVSPTLPWNQLAAGSEKTFLAHIDGLLVGGRPLVDRVLRPALAAKKAPSAHHAAAIVTTLLRGGRTPLAIRALAHDAPEVRRGALRGCVLSSDALLDGWIVQSLANPSSAIARPILLELASERALPIDSLPQAVRSEDPDERIAALRLTWRAPGWGVEASLLPLLRAPHPGVRDAAMLAALHHGSPEAWALCQQLAFSASAPNPLAMALIAGLGEPGQHRRLAEMAEKSATLRSPVLRALGYSGNAGMVPLLLEHAQSEDRPLAIVATEALATLLGNEVDGLIASKEDAAAWAQHWQTARARFHAGRRYLAGLPVSRGAFAHALTQFPGKRRFLLSLLLSIRTAGGSRVSTRASSATQSAQISALSSSDADQPWANEFSAF